MQQKDIEAILDMMAEDGTPIAYCELILLFIQLHKRYPRGGCQIEQLEIAKQKIQKEIDAQNEEGEKARQWWEDVKAGKVQP